MVTQGQEGLNESVPIVIDGQFDDWAEASQVTADPPGDVTADKLDLAQLALTNDEHHLYIRIETHQLVDPSENNGLTLLLDGGDGRVLEWKLGERRGVFRINGTVANHSVRYGDLGFHGLPTLDAMDFEFALRRDAKPDGVNALFPNDSLTIRLEDAWGDRIPDDGADAIVYQFTQGEFPKEALIDFERDELSDLRVVTYNIRNGNLFNERHQPGFRRQLEAVGPDVICFQEIRTQSAEETRTLMETWLPGTDGKAWFAAGGSDPDNDTITVSRFPISGRWDLYGSTLDRGNLAVLLDTRSQIGTQTLVINASLPCCGRDLQRQQEVDTIMAFIRDAKEPQGVLTMEADSPIIITGDMNFVGRVDQLTTMLAGDIVDNKAHGIDSAPDWDGTSFTSITPRHSDQRVGFTWSNDEANNFWPGHLDYLIYSDSALTVPNTFVVHTPSMSADRLSRYHLERNDSLSSDHLMFVADFRPIKKTTRLIVAKTEDGAVSLTPDLGNYVVGTEVTATAEPEEGFDFVKWMYGDEEFTSNPAIIVLKEGQTLTPIFAPVSEAPSMAHSIEFRLLQDEELELTIRGSQGPVTIESSMNLRTWIEHALVTLQGAETKLRVPIENGAKYYRVVPKEPEPNPEPGPILNYDATVLLETTSQTSANVSIGDVNADGHQDIVLAKGRHWPLMNRVLIGDGKGGFPSASNLGDEADRSYFGKLHDMDGDGDLDVVVSNDEPDTNKVYLNDGSGSFELSSLFGETAWKTRNASIADMDGDGLPDIIVANRSSDPRSGGTGGSNYICLNQGDGNFEGECIAFSHYSTTTITPADFNGDGLMDLAVPHRDGGQSHVFVQRKSLFSDLGFRKVPFGPSNASVRASQAADFNGDGRVDVVTIDTSRRELRVYYQEADGTYTTGIRLGGTSSVPYALLVDDLNGDQRPDIIIGHRQARAIVYFNDGGDSSEGFVAVPFGDARGAAYGFSTGDLNEDGLLDIAMARSDAPNVLYFGAKP